MEIVKYNVYLNEYQDQKLKVLASRQGKDPEEIVNNAVFGYLAIVGPYAEDIEEPLDDISP